MADSKTGAQFPFPPKKTLQDGLFQLPDFQNTSSRPDSTTCMSNTEAGVGLENQLMHKITRSNGVTIMLLRDSRCNGKYLTQNKYFKSSFITIFTTSFNVPENVFWSINTGQTASDTNSPPRHWAEFVHYFELAPCWFWEQ